MQGGGGGRDWQSEPSAFLISAFRCATLIRPSFQKRVAVSLNVFTYSLWSFQGPSHGTSWSILQPVASTAEPGAVDGQRSSAFGTPSSSQSPPGVDGQI